MSSTLGGIAGGAASEARFVLGMAVGIALANVLEPEATELRQTAFHSNPIRAPDAGGLALGVAQGQVSYAQAAEWAQQHGFGEEQFSALVDIANTGPAVGAAMQAWRRGNLTDAEFETALRRTGLEPQWDAAIMALKAERLDMGAIATAIHRGIMRGQGLIVREPPLDPGLVPFPHPSEIDPTHEAAAHGIDAERLRILVGNTGLPPGLIEMLHLLNMGHVTADDVRRAVAESNLRNEYMDVAIALRRRLLTPHEYVEARLRGWIDDERMHAGASLSGMEVGDTDLLAKLSGRPLSFHQAFIGERRGGRYGGPEAGIEHAFLRSLQESNIRPEWYELAWAQRYNYPTAFVLRAMTSSGDLSAAEAEQVLLFEGWEPGFAHKVAARWAAGGDGRHKAETEAELADEYAGGFLTEREFRAGLADLGYTGHPADLLVSLNDARRIKRWREKVVDAIAAAFLGFKIDDTRATAELAEANVTGEAASMLIALWRKQRIATVHELTPAQIVKAYNAGIMDEDAAVTALLHEHYTRADALTLLHE